MGMASASGDSDLVTLKKLYDLTMVHPSKPKDIEVDALFSAVMGR